MKDEYPSKCEKCGDSVKEPYGMHLFDSLESTKLVCLKCSYLEILKNNDHEIRNLQRENEEIKEQLTLLN